MKVEKVIFLLGLGAVQAVVCEKDPASPSSAPPPGASTGTKVGGCGISLPEWLFLLERNLSSLICFRSFFFVFFFCCHCRVLGADSVPKPATNPGHHKTDSSASRDALYNSLTGGQKATGSEADGDKKVGGGVSSEYVCKCKCMCMLHAACRVPHDRQQSRIYTRCKFFVAKVVQYNELDRRCKSVRIRVMYLLLLFVCANNC
jgi:hypothetical protein